MINTVIDELVQAIYKLEINKIENGFIRLLDELSKIVEVHADYDWNPILLKIQKAYMEKNYVLFSDILLYELKPVIESIGEHATHN